VTLKARGFKNGFAQSEVALFSPTTVTIQNLVVNVSGVYNSFTCQTLSNWDYQMQDADNPTLWRNFGAVQHGTNGPLTFFPFFDFPVPLRRLFRVQATQNSGL